MARSATTGPRPLLSELPEEAQEGLRIEPGTAPRGSGPARERHARESGRAGAGRALTGTDDESLRSLRRQWLAAAVVSLVVVVAVSAPLAGGAVLGRQTLMAVSVLAVLLAALARMLPENRRRAGDPLLARLGIANWVTVGRGVSTALLAGFLASPWPPGRAAWLPALLYTAVGVGDLLDGFLARWTGRRTRLGERLDLEVDACALLLAISLAVLHRRLPAWYLAVGLARYLFVLGIAQRRRRRDRVAALPPSRRRRLYAGFQMGFVSVALWPVAPVSGLRVAAVLFAAPSLVGFVRDWLVVSGRLDPASPQYRAVRRRLVVAFEQGLPMAARALLAASFAAAVVEVSGLPPDGWRRVLGDWGWSPDELWAAVIAVGAAGAAPALVAGLLARTLSLVLLFALVVELNAGPLAWRNGCVLLAALVLLLQGSGPLSLFAPEERLLRRRPSGAAGRETADEEPPER